MEKIRSNIHPGKGKKYLLTDVAACTFTFSDGLSSNLDASPDNEIVMVKLIPRVSKLKRFEELVLKNYSSAKNMSDLARLCHYDCLRSFSRHFKKCFGQTPYQWLLERKMEEVHSLVLSSDLTVTEIASIYGFRSVSHLVNLYSKWYGISPHKNRLSNAI
ncbi:MAG: AraC family transcriptional regulator [Proteiniphilum sp.]|jgi:AraC-like DNA-binding protein